MPYDVTDKSAKLAVAFGEHAVHNQNGKLIRHEAVAVGADLQVKFQTALGLGEWQSCERLTYDGVDIPAQNFEFYGNGSTAGQSALFPTDVAHAGAAMSNVNLPVGMSLDNDPDKCVGRYKTSKTADYTAAGAQTDFSYSPNPARAAVHGIKLLTGDTSIVEFGSFDEYKSWTASTITVPKDGAPIQIARFYLNAFFIPPFSLKQFLDRICALTCSDWQWRRGKIRFMPAVPRAPVFDFDLSRIARDFKFQALAKKNRPNGIRVLWRDFDHPLLKEAEPIVIKRPALVAADDGIENFYEFNAGVCNKSQAERTGNYLARLKCDLLDFALVRGSYKSYIVLPGDTVTLSHTTPDWTNKTCKVIKKIENEDKGIGYEHYLQLQPTNPYSDTDQTPLVTRAAVQGLNPYGAPPLAALTLAQDSALRSDGSTTNSLVGTISFGAFGFRQTGKVYWMKPTGGYQFLTDVTPDANNSGAFRAQNPPQGVNYFKVVTVSELNVSNWNVSTLNEKAVTVAANTFYVDGFAVSVGVFRALTGLDPNGKYIGRDTTVVPAEAIGARIDSAEIVSDNVWCVIAVSLKDLAGAHNQSDSASAAQVDVFDQFGALVKSFPPAAVSLKTATAVTSFPRKYADAREGQCYFRIKVLNNFGWSNVVYLQGTRITEALLGAKVPANCPREMTAAPVSSTVVQITFQFSGTSNLYRRAPLEPAWTQHVAGIAASPLGATGLSESTDYEFQLRSAADERNRSNIVRVRTKQQGEAAPSRPAPSALSGSPDASNPTVQINTAWVGNATDNVNVEVWKNGALADTVAASQTYYNFTGLAAGTPYLFKVRNKWRANDYSAFSNEITVSTQAAAAAAAPPEITSASYDTATQQANASFVSKGGAETYQTQYQLDGGAWTVDSAALSSAATAFSVAVQQLNTIERALNLRIKRNDVTGYSNEFGVIVPIKQTSSGGGGLGGGCFTGATPFDLSSDHSIAFAELYKRRAEFIGQEVLSFDANNNYTLRRILHVFRIKSNEFAVAKFSNGMTRKVTAKHRFWTENKEFVSICDLKAGDKVYDKNFELVEIKSVKIKAVKRAQWFYNATIEIDRAYFVGFAVSNSKPLS